MCLPFSLKASQCLSPLAAEVISQFQQICQRSTVSKEILSGAQTVEQRQQHKLMPHLTQILPPKFNNYLFSLPWWQLSKYTLASKYTELSSTVPAWKLQHPWGFSQMVTREQRRLQRQGTAQGNWVHCKKAEAFTFEGRDEESTVCRGRIKGVHPQGMICFNAIVHNSDVLEQLCKFCLLIILIYPFFFDRVLVLTAASNCVQSLSTFYFNFFDPKSKLILFIQIYLTLTHSYFSLLTSS